MCYIQESEETYHSPSFNSQSLLEVPSSVKYFCKDESHLWTFGKEQCYFFQTWQLLSWLVEFWEWKPTCPKVANFEKHWDS